MKTKAFTLIELLVVIAIIGILAAVVIASLNSARTKAKDTAIIAQAKQIMTAVEMYYNDNGAYPITGCGINCGIDLSTLTTFISAYISYMPNSPTLAYAVSSGGSFYGLRVILSTGSCMAGNAHSQNYWSLGSSPCPF